MSNIVKWGTYEESAAQQEAEELDKGGNSKFFSFKVGKNVVRFMPPPLSKKTPFRKVWQHTMTIGGETRSVPCPRLEAKLPCPICVKADQLKGSSNPADQERAKDYFAKPRVYANIINREAPENGPMVVGFGKTVHEPLVALRTDPDAGGDFTHPETGFDIIIERKGTGKMDTEYKVFAARKASPLGNNEWIDQQVDLEQFAKILTPDEMRERLGGQKAAPKAEPEVREVNKPPARAAATRTVEHDTVGAPASQPDDGLPF